MIYVDTFNSFDTVNMCRHLEVMCRHLQFFGYYLHVSTPRNHLSTPSIPDLFTDHVCRLFNPMCWHFYFRLFTVYMCRFFKVMCRHFISKIVSSAFMCRYFKIICRHLLLRTHFNVFLGHLSIKQFKPFKGYSLWIYIFKVFNSVIFITSSNSLR